jgi:hypothetical protein
MLVNMCQDNSYVIAVALITDLVDISNSLVIHGYRRLRPSNMTKMAFGVSLTQKTSIQRCFLGSNICLIKTQGLIIEPLVF